MSEKHGNDDSGIGCSPLSAKLEGERNEMPSLPSCFQQSPTTESTNMNYSELIINETEAFRKRGDIDHVFTGSVKCELCDFKPMRLFQYYHHIIVHCKRTDDADFEIDSAQALNTEHFHNGDNSLKVIDGKKKRRRKNPKSKSCKVRNCDFVTTAKSDVTETKKELWMHMRKNHKFPLVCRLCPFVTEPKHHMVYHWLGEHTKLRPFKCEEPNCSYSCVAKSMLNSHVVRHWNVHQYNCMDCNFKARLLHAMKKHMREKNHTHVLILNEDGTQNLKSIDVYGNKRGPRRNTFAKNQDKSDQSDINQSRSSTASPEPEQTLVSHPEVQQQLESVESVVENSNDSNNQSNLLMMYSSLLHTLRNMSSIITDTILNWHNNKQNQTSWNYLMYMFNQLFGETPYMNAELDPQNPLKSLFVMQKLIEFYIDHISKINHSNFETINNTGAGPSNDRNDANHTDRLSIFNGLKHQPETQNIPTIDCVNFEATNSEAGPSDYKKYTNQASASNKRKAEELDDIATIDLSNNNKTNCSNTISNEISTSEELDSQPQIQIDKIPNKPLSTTKSKITGATKRKVRKARFAAEENMEKNQIESFALPMDSEDNLQRESQINVTVNNVNIDHNCEYCDLTFGNKFMHDMHMRFHNIKDPYTCNVCGERCVDSLDFNSHLIRGKH